MRSRAADVKPYSPLWAKSGEPPLSLICHLLDTAAVVLEVLAREPAGTLARYSAALGMRDDATAAFLAAAAGCHDLGKATPGFQEEWPPGRQHVEQSGFSFKPIQTVSRPAPHGALTEALLRPWLAARGLHRRCSSNVARAVGAHHGFAASQTELTLSEDPDVVGGEEWTEARDALLSDLFAALEVDTLPGVERLDDAVTVGLMALASVGDWIASSAEHFPYGRDAGDLRAYVREARQLARRALDAIGWTRRRPLADAPRPFATVFPSILSPNDLQRTLADAVERLSTPPLVIVEAPMGAGKTEAALYAHLVLQRRLGHRGLYVALPTMASGNGMFPRLRDFLGRFGGRPIDLQLQHGNAWINPAYQTLRPRAVGDAGDDGVQAREWFTPKKRAMLSEYGVGTVDQALLGVVRVRHHFVRLFGLGNRTVVLDEVHAYDAYTSGLIEGLVSWLGHQGSSVILMSATLPRSRRHALLQAYGAPPPVPEAAYPRITVARAGQAESVGLRIEDRKVIEIERAPVGVEALGALALNRAKPGGCVACIVNTVDRAQRLYAAMPQGKPLWEAGLLAGKRVGDLEVYLFHARYPSEERQARERRVLRLFGKKGYTTGARPQRSLLIATQVIEQSLDLDFDAMLTDLAPVDLVLQRAGRLHRFGDRARPEAHRLPRLCVSGLADDPPDVREWDRVYSAYILLRSWLTLRDRDRLAVPDDLEDLVENVYSTDDTGTPSHLRARLTEARERHEQELRREEDWSRAARVDHGAVLEAPSDHLGAMRLDDDEDQDVQVPFTRYGEPSVGVVPLHRISGQLYLDPAGKEPAVMSGELDDATAKRIFLRSVRLSGAWVYRELYGRKPAKAWEKHPITRRLRPLEFTDGVAWIGKVRLRLDPELGIVYESTEML
jgi:CRISPR-associated endonuclease/helicase Cas3